MDQIQAKEANLGHLLGCTEVLQQQVQLLNDQIYRDRIYKRQLFIQKNLSNVKDILKQLFRKSVDDYCQLFILESLPKQELLLAVKDASAKAVKAAQADGEIRAREPSAQLSNAFRQLTADVRKKCPKAQVATGKIVKGVVDLERGCQEALEVLDLLAGEAAEGGHARAGGQLALLERLVNEVKTSALSFKTSYYAGAASTVPDAPAQYSPPTASHTSQCMVQRKLVAAEAQLQALLNYSMPIQQTDQAHSNQNRANPGNLERGKQAIVQLLPRKEVDATAASRAKFSVDLQAGVQDLLVQLKDLFEQVQTSLPQQQQNDGQETQSDVQNRMKALEDKKQALEKNLEEQCNRVVALLLSGPIERSSQEAASQGAIADSQSPVMAVAKAVSRDSASGSNQAVSTSKVTKPIAAVPAQLSRVIRSHEPKVQAELEQLRKQVAALRSDKARLQMRLDKQQQAQQSQQAQSSPSTVVSTRHHNNTTTTSPATNTPTTTPGTTPASVTRAIPITRTRHHTDPDVSAQGSVASPASHESSINPSQRGGPSLQRVLSSHPSLSSRNSTSSTQNRRSTSAKPAESSTRGDRSRAQSANVRRRAAVSQPPSQKSSPTGTPARKLAVPRTGSVDSAGRGRAEVARASRPTADQVSRRSTPGVGQRQSQSNQSNPSRGAAGQTRHDLLKQIEQLKQANEKLRKGNVAKVEPARLHLLSQVDNLKQAQRNLEGEIQSVVGPSREELMKEVAQLKETNQKLTTELQAARHVVLAQSVVSRGDGMTADVEELHSKVADLEMERQWLKQLVDAQGDQLMSTRQMSNMLKGTPRGTDISIGSTGLTPQTSAQPAVTHTNLHTSNTGANLQHSDMHESTHLHANSSINDVNDPASMLRTTLSYYETLAEEHEQLLTHSQMESMRTQELETLLSSLLDDVRAESKAIAELSEFPLSLEDEQQQQQQQVLKQQYAQLQQQRKSSEGRAVGESDEQVESKQVQTSSWEASLNPDSLETMSQAHPALDENNNSNSNSGNVIVAVNNSSVNVGGGSGGSVGGGGTLRSSQADRSAHIVDSTALSSVAGEPARHTASLQLPSRDMEHDVSAAHVSRTLPVRLVASKEGVQHAQRDSFGKECGAPCTPETRESTRREESVMDWSDQTEAGVYISSDECVSALRTQPRASNGSSKQQLLQEHQQEEAQQEVLQQQQHEQKQQQPQKSSGVYDDGDSSIATQTMKSAATRAAAAETEQAEMSPTDDGSVTSSGALIREGSLTSPAIRDFVANGVEMQLVSEAEYKKGLGPSNPLGFDKAAHTQSSRLSSRNGQKFESTSRRSSSNGYNGYGSITRASPRRAKNGHVASAVQQQNGSSTGVSSVDGMVVDRVLHEQFESIFGGQSSGGVVDGLVDGLVNDLQSTTGQYAAQHAPQHASQHAAQHASQYMSSSTADSTGRAIDHMLDGMMVDMHATHMHATHMQGMMNGSYSNMRLCGIDAGMISPVLTHAHHHYQLDTIPEAGGLVSSTESPHTERRNSKIRNASIIIATESLEMDQYESDLGTRSTWPRLGETRGSNGRSEDMGEVGLMKQGSGLADAASLKTQKTDNFSLTSEIYEPIFESVRDKPDVVVENVAFMDTGLKAELDKAAQATTLTKHGGVFVWNSNPVGDSQQGDRLWE